jgi:hypothetical protein
MDMWSGHQPFAVNMLRQLYGTRPQSSSPQVPPQLDPAADKLFAGLCAAGGMNRRNILHKLFHGRIRVVVINAALQKLLAAAVDAPRRCGLQ